MTAMFEFTHAGKTYSIPQLKDVKTGVIRKARHAEDDADRFFTIIELTLGEDSPELAAIDDMNAEELQETLTAWAKGVPLGESSSSSS